MYPLLFFIAITSLSFGFLDWPSQYHSEADSNHFADLHYGESAEILSDSAAGILSQVRSIEAQSFMLFGFLIFTFVSFYFVNSPFDTLPHNLSVFLPYDLLALYNKIWNWLLMCFSWQFLTFPLAPYSLLYEYLFSLPILYSSIWKTEAAQNTYLRLKPLKSAFLLW